jgi:Recombination endonuclease VII
VLPPLLRGSRRLGLNVSDEERKARKAASSKKWRDKNKHRQQGYKLKHKYGLTPEQYAVMLEQQGHRCAVCRTDDTGSSRGRFFVDHCHSTNAVRGLLCHNCNSALGLLKDNTATLTRAIEYLICAEAKA